MVEEGRDLRVVRNDFCVEMFASNPRSAPYIPTSFLVDLIELPRWAKFSLIIDFACFVSVLNAYHCAYLCTN